MSIVAGFIVIAFYFFFRQFWFSTRKIQHVGLIERIDLCIISPDVFLNEVEVTYKYYFGGGVYKGKGYANLFDFLGTGEYRLFYNSKMIPILEVGDKQIISEEHIESYLLSFVDTVNIYIDPIEPYRSKMIDLQNNSLSAKKT
jgi:hypothetical protein